MLTMFGELRGGPVGHARDARNEPAISTPPPAGTRLPIAAISIGMDKIVLAERRNRCQGQTSVHSTEQFTDQAPGARMAAYDKQNAMGVRAWRPPV